MKLGGVDLTNAQKKWVDNQDTKKARDLRASKVGATGFEPATFWSQTRRASQAAPRPDGLIIPLTGKR